MITYKDLTARECAIRLTEIKDPAILIHVRPDGDAVGSAAALAEIFRQLGTDAVIVSDDPIPERLQFITERLSVSVENNTDRKAAVAIDVASPTQLGSLTRYSPILMIDHHKVGERFADGYVAPDASSAAEALLDVVYELIKMGKVSLTEPLAYALFAAISSDTGCFAYSNASAKTHRYAASLIEVGIDASDINHRLFTSKSKEQIKAEGYIASKIESCADGRIAYATVTLCEIESLGLKKEHFETAIDVVRSLFGAEIALVIKETESGKYKASLRSVGANVANVAAKFGGGGHVRAAGCSPNAASIDGARDLVLSELYRIYENEGN